MSYIDQLKQTLQRCREIAEKAPLKYIRDTYAKDIPALKAKIAAEEAKGK